MKTGGQKKISRIFKKPFNDCLNTGEIPNLWRKVKVIILHKKGDKEDIKNYRAISLLSHHLYKLLTRILTNGIKISSYYSSTSRRRSIQLKNGRIDSR